MKLIFILFLLPLQLFAQDISGIWAGTIQTQGFDLEYQLVISQQKEELSGYSLTVFAIDGVDNMGIKSVIFKKKKGNISVEDDDLIYNNYTTSPKRVKLFGTLSLTEADTGMYLDGTFYTRQIDLRSPDDNLYSGTIHLRRLDNSAQTKLTEQLDKMNLFKSLSFYQSAKKETGNPVVSTQQPVATTAIVQQPPAIEEKKEAPEKVSDFGDLVVAKSTNSNRVVSTPKKTDSAFVKPDKSLAEKKNNAAIPTKRLADLAPSANAAAKIAERKTEVIRSVFFRSDSLTFSLYDNGTVDGDTVSVVMNGRVIIPRQGLTGLGFRVTVPTPTDLGDSLLVTMYAENLGTIAPNTGLLIIQDGNERSEIRFEGDLQKSSAIILKRRR